MERIEKILLALFLAFPVYTNAQIGDGMNCNDSHELVPGSCGTSTTIETGFIDNNGFGNIEGLSGSCWGAGNGDVTWYKFEATATSHFIDAECYTGTSADVMMAAFTGTCGALAEIGCSDAGKSGPCPISGITLAGLTIGTTYYIITESVDADQPIICVEGADPPPPPNDDCANAINATNGTVFSTTNVNATPDKDLCAGSTENNIWFYWTAPLNWPAGDTAYVHLFNQNCALTSGMQLSFWLATNCAAIPDPSVLADCIDASSTQTDSNIYFTWIPIAGNTYYFDLDGFGGTECIFDFLINNTACLTLTASSFSAASCGGNDGSATVTALNNDNTPFTFKWDDGTVGSDPLFHTNGGLAAGDYIVTIIDAGGCEIIDTVTVKGPVDASFTFSGDSCLATNSISFTHTGTAVDACGMGCPTFYWNFGDASATVTTANATHTYAAAGTYSVMHVVDDGTCKDTVTTNVVIVDCACPLTVTAGTGSTVCTGSAGVTFTGTYANENCTPSGGVGNASEGGTLDFCYGTFYDPQGPTGKYTQDVYGSFPTGYYRFGDGTAGSVKVCFTSVDLNMSSCMGEQDEIRVYDGAGALNGQVQGGSFTAFSGATLSGNCFTVNTTDGYAYIRFLTWCTPDGTYDGWTATYTTVDGSGNCACPSGVCADPPCPTFSWGPGTNLSSTTTLATTFNPPGTAGTYVFALTVTDYQCTVFDTVSMTVINCSCPSLTPINSGHVRPSCNGNSDGSASVTAFAGTAGWSTPLSFTWVGGGAVVSTDTISTMSGLVAGTYTVTIRDAGATCDTAVTITVTQPDVLVATWTKGTTTTCATCTCEEWALFNTTGGTLPRTYIWSDGYTARYQNNLCPGTFTATVTDANGCTASGTVTLP